MGHFNFSRCLGGAQWLTGDFPQTLLYSTVLANIHDKIVEAAQLFKNDATEYSLLEGVMRVVRLTGNKIKFQERGSAGWIDKKVDASGVDVSIQDASETQKGVVERATDTEAETGDDDERYITARHLKMFGVAAFMTIVSSNAAATPAGTVDAVVVARVVEADQNITITVTGTVSGDDSQATTSFRIAYINMNTGVRTVVSGQGFFSGTGEKLDLWLYLHQV